MGFKRHILSLIFVAAYSVVGYSSDNSDSFRLDEQLLQYRYQKLNDIFPRITYKQDPSVVKINNFTKYQIEEFLTLALHLQNVSGVTVDVIEYNYNLSTPNTDVLGFLEKFDYEAKRYAIFITNRCTNVWELILHESTHIAQYEEGVMEKIDSSKVKYDGLIVDFLKVPYDIRPHEIDARNRDYGMRITLADALFHSN